MYKFGQAFRVTADRNPQISRLSSYNCVYGCMFCMLLITFVNCVFICYVYVFLLLCSPALCILFHCVVICIVYVEMCVLLPPGFNPVRVNKYIIPYIKAARLKALSTGRLKPKNILILLIFVKRLSRSQSHRMAGKIMLMKISSDTIGKRTRDPPACSELPQRTAPTSAPNRLCSIHYVFSRPIETVNLYKRLEFSAS